MLIRLTPYVGQNSKNIKNLISACWPFVLLVSLAVASARDTKIVPVVHMIPAILAGREQVLAESRLLTRQSAMVDSWPVQLTLDIIMSSWPPWKKSDCKFRRVGCTGCCLLLFAAEIIRLRGSTDACSTAGVVETKLPTDDHRFSQTPVVRADGTGQALRRLHLHIAFRRIPASQHLHRLNPDSLKITTASMMYFTVHSRGHTKEMNNS